MTFRRAVTDSDGAVEVSEDGSVVALRVEPSVIELFDTSNGGWKSVQRVTSKRGGELVLPGKCISRDGSRVLCLEDGDPVVWDVRAKSWVVEDWPFAGRVALSPDGRKAVTSQREEIGPTFWNLAPKPVPRSSAPRRPWAAWSPGE